MNNNISYDKLYDDLFAYEEMHSIKLFDIIKIIERSGKNEHREKAMSDIHFSLLLVSAFD